MLTVRWAITWLDEAARVVVEHRDELLELDRQIGDGDHGENLTRGFNAVQAKLLGLQARTIADVLKMAASTLMSTVGGAAGPLYGTAFLRAAKTCDTESLDARGVANLLAAATEGIIARGKAAVGDKTMVDAWQPASDAAQAAAESGASPLATLEAAAHMAAVGAQQTEPVIARKGRASYLGERARGHRDPGAQSSALLLAAAVSAAQKLGVQ